MKQFTLGLYDHIRRPVVYLEDWNKYDAMLDTGALFPVWIAEEETLMRLGAVCVDKDVPFGGFGGKTAGNLYKLPFFKIGMLIFPDFPIITSRISAPWHMIMSATMFSHLRYEIDDDNHKLNVTIPDNQSEVRNLKIWRADGTLQVLCTSGEHG